MIGSMAMAMLDAPVFADVSPILGPILARSKVEPARVELAQADIPKGVGSVSDYMHQEGDGPSTSAVSQPPQSFYPPAAQSFSPQGIPSQEWNYQYANPKISRDALIGTAIVGALAVGLWAYQQQRCIRLSNARRVDLIRGDARTASWIEPPHERSSINKTGSHSQQRYLRH